MQLQVRYRMYIGFPVYRSQRPLTPLRAPAGHATLLARITRPVAYDKKKAARLLTAFLLTMCVFIESLSLWPQGPVTHTKHGTIHLRVSLAATTYSHV